jgi:sialate O-acetylesterase
MLKLNSIFQDNMVLPYGKVIRILGTSKPLEKISGQIFDQNVDTFVNEEGKFCLEFQPIYRRESTKLKISSSLDNLQLNINMGETFLFSGQSNIEFRLKDSKTYQSTLEKFPSINAYYYEVPQIEYIFPDGTVKPKNIQQAQWKKITRENCGEVSAIAFYSVVAMQRDDISVPIGIIDCYKGGTSASSWIALDTLRRNDNLNLEYVESFNEKVKGKTCEDFKREHDVYTQKVKKHDNLLNNFIRKNPRCTLSEAKNVVGHTPWPPPAEPTSYLRPGGLYETMFLKISFYSFTQVIWYQGENDAEHANVYGDLLRTLIRNWRIQLKDKVIPFSIIQLPGYADQAGNLWAKIRQAQLQVSNTLPNINLISIIDTGEKHNIHPIDKKKVGIRLGKCLRGFAYKSTPKPEVDEWTSEKLILKLSNVKEINISGNVIFQYETAGKKYEITPIIEKTMLIFNEDIEKLYYQYTNFTEPTVFNEEGTPLAAFKIVRKDPDYGLRIN